MFIDIPAFMQTVQTLIRRQSDGASNWATEAGTLGINSLNQIIYIFFLCSKIYYGYTLHAPYYMVKMQCLI